MRPYLLVLLLVTGCATTGQGEIRQSWIPKDQSFWQAARGAGAKLRTNDGGFVFVSRDKINNLMAVKFRLEQASGEKADLALVDTELPNAFATVHQGRPLVAFSLSYLDHLGNDQDAIASTMGHELAHLRLGHSGAVRAEREKSAQAGSNVLGTILNVAGVPFGGAIASIGVSAVSRSFTRDEERQADDLGLKWTVDAGFNPCGAVRVMQTLSKFGQGNIPILSTHPGFEERIEKANAASMTARNTAC